VLVAIAQRSAGQAPENRSQLAYAASGILECIPFAVILARKEVPDVGSGAGRCGMFRVVAGARRLGLGGENQPGDLLVGPDGSAPALDLDLPDHFVIDSADTLVQCARHCELRTSLHQQRVVDLVERFVDRRERQPEVMDKARKVGRTDAIG
jgi:hypothetical protein